jgi:hypothetical protein
MHRGIDGGHDLAFASSHRGGISPRGRVEAAILDLGQIAESRIDPVASGTYAPDP